MTQSIDLQKLASLRDAHSLLHAKYRDVSERSRFAQDEAAQLRSPHIGGTDAQKQLAARYLNLPIAELQRVPEEQLIAARIAPRHVQRLVSTQARADALKAEAAQLAPALHRSAALISKINEYALTREHL